MIDLFVCHSPLNIVPLLTHTHAQLKPRSARLPRQRQNSRSALGGGGSDSLFGEARPREEILRQRGLDAQDLDRQYDRKAAPIHYTPDQEQRLEQVRAALELAAAALRDANENEMPEDEFRRAEEQQRKELNALLEEFAKTNLSGDGTTTTAAQRRQSGAARAGHRGRFETGGDSDNHQDYRSSGRYSKEEKKEGDPAFASFSTTRRRHSSTDEGQHA